MSEKFNYINDMKKSWNKMLKFTKYMLIIDFFLGIPFFIWSYINHNELSFSIIIFIITIFVWIIIVAFLIGVKYIKKSYINFLKIIITIYFIFIVVNIIGWAYEAFSAPENTWTIMQGVFNGIYSVQFLVFAGFAWYTLFINRNYSEKIKKQTVFYIKVLIVFMILQLVFYFISVIIALAFPSCIPIKTASVYQLFYPVWNFSIFGFTLILAILVVIRTLVNWNLEWLEAFPQFVTDREREIYRANSRPAKE